MFPRTNGALTSKWTCQAKWERDKCDPDKQQWLKLSKLLDIPKERFAGLYEVPEKGQDEIPPGEATVLNSLTPISKADIGKILPDVSATTIEAVLGQMVRTGSIRKVGTGRGTKYVKN